MQALLVFNWNIISVHNILDLSSLSKKSWLKLQWLPHILRNMARGDNKREIFDKFGNLTLCAPWYNMLCDLYIWISYLTKQTEDSSAESLFDFLTRWDNIPYDEKLMKKL